MKKLLTLAFLSFGMIQAQDTGHLVVLQWEDLLNPAGSTTYSVYRSQGLCSATPTWNKISTGLTVKTYSDNTVTTGNWCYMVTASIGGIESSPSNTALAPVPAFVPTKLGITQVH